MKQTLLIISFCFAGVVAQAQNIAVRPVAATNSALVVNAVRANAPIEVQAVEQIEAKNVVERSAVATYTAGKAVLLQPGFEARAGSVFLATIAPVSLQSAEAGSDLTVSAWPNPFQDQTTIDYKLPESSTVKHTLTDSRGVVLRQHTPTEVQPAGTYKVGVEGTNLPTGVYIYQVQTGSQTKTIRLLKQ
jgi:Secretion system C-terminal sorting domain